MIALAKSCKGGGSLLNYIMNPSKGYELFRNNLCGETPNEILEEFKIIQALNQRSTNKTLSLVLSPEIEDGKKLNDNELIIMTNEFLSELGINTEQQQFLAFVHIEKRHKHLHIYCQRVIPTSGKLIDDHHIGKRSQWIAHRIALKRGLTSAKQIMIDKIKSNEISQENNPKSIKEQIFQKHLKALEKHLDSLQEYINVMKEMGVLVEPTINKQGLVQGHRMIDLKTNENFKASEINRKINLKDIGIKKATDEYEIKKNKSIIKRYGK